MGLFTDDRSDYGRYKQDKEELENEEMLEFFILGFLGIALVIVVVGIILYAAAGWLDQTFGTQLVPFLNEHLPEVLQRRGE